MWARDLCELMLFIWLCLSAFCSADGWPWGSWQEETAHAFAPTPTHRPANAAHTHAPSIDFGRTENWGRFNCVNKKWEPHAHKTPLRTKNDARAIFTCRQQRGKPTSGDGANLMLQWLRKLSHDERRERIRYYMKALVWHNERRRKKRAEGGERAMKRESEEENETRFEPFFHSFVRFLVSSFRSLNFNILSSVFVLLCIIFDYSMPAEKSIEGRYLDQIMFNLSSVNHLYVDWILMNIAP